MSQFAQIISVSFSSNDYENVDFEDSIFATVSRPRLKSDYEATSNFSVYSLPRGTTVHHTKYHNYVNIDVSPTMETSEATAYEIPRSSIYQDPGNDEEAICKCFDTMRLQKLRSKGIT